MDNQRLISGGGSTSQAGKFDLSRIDFSKVVQSALRDSSNDQSSDDSDFSDGLPKRDKAVDDI